MFLEVPLAGLAAANARRGDRGRAAGGDRRRRRPRARHAAVQRRRQALPPDPRRGRRQRAAARVHRLDPRGAAAAADREHLPARGRRARSCASTATSSARSAAVSPRPPSSAMRAHIAYLLRRFTAATREASAPVRAASGASSHSWIARTPPRPERAPARRARRRMPYSPSSSTSDADPRLRRRRRRSAPTIARHPGAARPGRGAAGVQRDVAAVPVADEVVGLGALRRGQRHRLAVDPHAAEDRHGARRRARRAPTRRRACAGTPSASRDRGAQPQRVVERVAEHAPPVASVARSRAVSGSTGLVTMITTPCQPASAGDRRRRSRALASR